MPLSTFTLTGQYKNLDGSPASGRVVLEATTTPITDPDGNVVFAGPRSLVLDVTGKFSAILPTTGGGVQPTTFGYRLTAELKHQALPRFEFAPPVAGSTLDVADIVPTTVVAPTPGAITTDTLDSSVQGKVNDLASLTRIALDQKYVTPRAKTTTGAAASVPWVNIRDYGASPSNTAAANQTAIQNALNAAAGGICLVPDGTFLHNDAFTIPNNTWLAGVGPASALKADALANGGAGIGLRQIDATNKTGWMVSHLTLDASGITAFAAGMRTIWSSGSSNWRVQHCTFITPGAATAAIQSFDYWVTDNKITVSATDGIAHHDGVIDQWDGCRDFTVRGNTINGGGIAKYPILVTGENGAGTAAACFRFTITGNTIRSAKIVGIWVNGREGINTDFQVANNTIDGVTDFHGLALSDVRRFSCAGNTIRGVGAQGIRCYQETATGGITGAQDGTISGNVVDGANAALSASAQDGSAIVVADNSGGIVVAGNRVKGTTHTYAVYFGTSTTNCDHSGRAYDAGTQGRVFNAPDRGTYTPTLTAVANVAASTPRACRWVRNGDFVTVTGRVEVTPTATATATQLGISLPVASAFTDVTVDLAGVASTQFGLVGAVSADVTNARAQLQFQSNNTTNNILYFTITYTVK